MILDASCMAFSYTSYETAKPDVVRDRDSICLSIRSSVFNVEYPDPIPTLRDLESVIVTDALGKFSIPDRPSK